ncbi:hypothetical protein C807_00295 [Lachnospiraceae bacterium 28-4]|nr:hypothetical protein C807_00295 [Lachnospiraceae bacterium 28-4]
MKRNRTFTFIMLLLIVLGLSACSSQKQKLSGKYIDIYDETHYVSFDKDGTFIDNFLTTTSKGNTSISDFYVYKIDDNGLITIIDTTEYEGQNTLDEYQLGILYKNYIGAFWNGVLSITYKNTTITNILGDLILTYNFKEDKTYEYTVTSNNKIVHTENGTYTINGKEVVCTSEEGVVTTFINADDKVFCIEYVKE